MASEESKSRADASVDPSTYANVDEVVTRNIALDWTVNFEARNITGSATLTCQVVASSASKLVLDTRDIKVARVTVDGA